MRLPETGAGPGDRRGRGRGHRFAAMDGSSIVIAENGDGSRLHHLRHAIDHPARISSVADEVTKEYISIGASALRLNQTGGQGLTIGVNIGQ